MVDSFGVRVFLGPADKGNGDCFSRRNICHKSGPRAEPDGDRKSIKVQRNRQPMAARPTSNRALHRDHCNLLPATPSRPGQHARRAHAASTLQHSSPLLARHSLVLSESPILAQQILRLRRSNPDRKFFGPRSPTAVTWTNMRRSDLRYILLMGAKKKPDEIYKPQPPTESTTH